MFNVIYIYCVPRENEAEFLRIQNEAGDIYRSYGSLVEETLVLTSHEPKYGCVSFSDAVDVRNDEKIFVSLSEFKEKAHHDDVMRRIDSDPRIDLLFQEMSGLIDLNRVIRGEFTTAV